MSSVSRAPQNTSQGDAFFVNLTNFYPAFHVLDASGNPIDNVVGINYGDDNMDNYSPGALFLRDMGKTIRVPGQTLDANWVGKQRILRKVQVVAQGSTRGPFPVSNGFINFNEGVTGAGSSNAGSLPSGFATFYVDLGRQGTDNPQVRFARMSVQ
jgi:hypothetical protein